MNEKNTDSEKAAIYYELITGCTNREILYTIAVGLERVNKLTDGSKRQTAARWYNLDRIRNLRKSLIYDIERKKDIFIQEQRKAWETETTKSQTETSGAGAVNFLDRDQFLEFLNQKANSQTDEKLQNETLKMLSDNLRYKDGEQETTEIQRFYVPVVCENCEIYKRCKDCSGCNCGK